jgi:hypothetical protein
MAETVVILCAVGLLITVCAILTYGAGWLIFSTPFLRWCLITTVGFLALRVALLPFDHLRIWWSGDYPDAAIEEQDRARTEIALSTRIIPTQRSGKFTLLAQGSVTNNSDRVIAGITIWCRVPKLGFGDSEVTRRRIIVTAHPKETKSFSGEIASDLTGIAKTGHIALQAPDEHFCRLDRVNASR